MLLKGCVILRQSRRSFPRLPAENLNLTSIRLFSEESKHSDDAKASGTEYYADKTKQSAGFFTDGVKATVGTVVQKAKEAIGVEKPLGKEGAGSMEPAGVMENQQDPGARYEELIGKHKKKDDNLLKGAKPTDLYRENSKATSAANEKPGGDDLLNKQAADR